MVKALAGGASPDAQDQTMRNAGKEEMKKRA
jgi:hypothetical protein